MKKVVNIFIVAVLLFANVGYVIGYFATLQVIKNERFKQIRTANNYNDCSRFILSNDVQNEMHFEFWSNKEFEYKGIMYDIVSTKFEDGVKVVYALMDNKESNFIAHFKSFMNNSIAGKSNVVHFFKFISHINQNCIDELYKLFIFERCINLFEINSIRIPQNYFLEILKPPPNGFALEV